MDSEAKDSEPVQVICVVLLMVIVVVAQLIVVLVAKAALEPVLLPLSVLSQQRVQPDLQQILALVVLGLVPVPIIFVVLLMVIVGIP
jgi:ABC-type glycerol-3-phosphate transport system permease component